MPPAAKINLRWLFLALALALVVGAATLRGWRLGSRELEYDELWTLQHYVLQGTLVDVFTDLATPNNHPLHTLAVRASVKTFGLSAATLRLPAWLAGVLLIPLVLLLGWRLFDNRWAGLIAATLAGGGGLLAHFSQTARGYSMQAMLLTAAGLLLVERRRLARPSPVLAGLFLLSATAAILVLPTSLLWLFPICLTYCALAWRAASRLAAPTTTTPSAIAVVRQLCRRHGDMLVGCAALALFCLAWYGGNRAAFQAGQTFGEPLAGPWKLAKFGWTTLRQTTGLLWLAAPVAMLAMRRQVATAWLLTGLTALPLLAALLTRGGPPRAYLPICVIAALATAGAYAALAERIGPRPGANLFGPGVAAATLAVALAGGSARMANFAPVEWGRVVRELHQAAPPPAYACFPATDGYPLRANADPNLLALRLRRQLASGDTLLLVGTGDHLSGMDAEGRQQTLPAVQASRPVPLTGLVARQYTLEAIPHTAPPATETMIVSIGPLPAPHADRVVGMLLAGGSETILLNGWLRPLARSRDGSQAWACLATRSPATLADVAQLAQAIPGRVSCLAIRGLPPVR